MSNCKCSIKIKNLQVKHGGNTIIRDVTLTANHGETLALIGQNGAGKTTLLKAILHNSNHKNSIHFFDSNGKRIMHPKIGYVPQKLDFDYSTPITVIDLFCANSCRWPVWLLHSKSKRKKAYDILERVSAHDLMDKPIGKLSGGELQRVLLALALEPHPDILLLDEPVSAVDRKGISQFYSVIKSMRDDYHMPVILVSHDLGHVAKYATSYALINHTVMEVGSAQDLYESQNVRQTFGLDVDRGGKIWK